MASLVDEETTSDIQDIEHKVLQHLKTYAFFVYYEKAQFEEEDPITIQVHLWIRQKLNFKLREDKHLPNEKYGDNNKLIQLHFCNL